MSKGQPNDLLPSATTMRPAESIKLLKRQVARAEALLAGQVFDPDEVRNWRATTDQVLADALGADHDLAVTARAARIPRHVIRGEQDREEQARRLLGSQAKALEPCIEYLQRQLAGSRNVSTAPDDDRDNFFFDTATVCRNGHVMNDSVHIRREPIESFCPVCGSVVLSTCTHCKVGIRGGHYRGRNKVDVYVVPAHCHRCGKPFPWTEAKLRAVSDLLAMSDASDADQAALRDSLPALQAESPGTSVAVAKWKRFFVGAGKQMVEGFRDLFVDIAAEAVNRKLFP